VGGFLSSYILERLREGRADRKELGEKIYRPILIQFNRALDEINEGKRAYAIDLAFWEGLKSSTKTERIRPKLRVRLEDIYANFYPTHESVWQKFQGTEFPHIMEGWDSQFGIQQDRKEGEKWPDWFLFLTSDTFRPSLINAMEGQPFRLWNKYVPAQRFGETKEGLNSFLHERWLEARKLPEIQRFKEVQTNLRRAISSALPELKNLAR